MDPAGATIGLRPLLLLLTCIALCIKLGWVVAHVDSFDKLRGSEPYCYTVSHFGSYFVPMCEVTEIAVVTSMSFVLGTDTFMVFH